MTSLSDKGIEAAGFLGGKLFNGLEPGIITKFKGFGKVLQWCTNRLCVSDIFPLWWVRTFVPGFQWSGMELIIFDPLTGNKSSSGVRSTWKPSNSPTGSVYLIFFPRRQYGWFHPTVHFYTDSVLLIKEYAIMQRLCGLFMSVETLLE